MPNVGHYRIWYQSFVHPVEQAPYIERLQAMLVEVAAPGVRFEVHGLDPPDHSFHPLTEFRCAGQAIRNALEAEKSGYDAFVLGHFQEPGLLEIRGCVDIPVIGLGEANLLAGLSLGHRFGLVTIDPIFIPWHDRQVKTCGLAERYAGTTALKMDLPSFMKAFADEAAYVRVREQFVAQVKPLVAAGGRGDHPGRRPAHAAVRARMSLRRRRRTDHEWRRRGGESRRDGACAESDHQGWRQPAEHLCEGAAGGDPRVSRPPGLRGGCNLKSVAAHRAAGLGCRS